MNEQLSALIDDEIDMEDIAHLIVSIQPSSQAGEAWSQYHMIGDVMRGATVLSPSFKKNLMQKIELEATVLAPNAAFLNSSNDNKHKNKLPLVWSIAASFAAATVVGWMVLHQQTQNGKELAPVEVAQAVTTQPVSAEQEIIPVEYLMAHQASAPSASSYYIQSASYSK